MSTIDLSDFLKQQGPISQRAIIGIKENPLSKRIRKLDDATIKFPQGLGVFLTTNEVRVREIAERLKETPPIPHSCHIGFSAWHNFDIMAIRKPEYGIICDYNPASTFFMEETLEILRNSQNRKEFIAQITQLIDHHGKASYQKLFHPLHKTERLFTIVFAPNVIETTSDYRDCTKITDEVEVELKRKGSWLANEESFRIIQNMARQDKIACMTQNICNTEVFAKMRSLLSDNGIQIDSLYLSNIPDYIYGIHRAALKETAQLLTEKDTHVIIANRHRHTVDLEQHFIEGATFKKETVDLDLIFWKSPSLEEIIRDFELLKG